MKLLEENRLEPALNEFMLSRDILPTRTNTQNAALTLERLGRFDEALDLLEQMLTDFADLTPSQRSAIEIKVVELKRQLARIIVTNVEPGLSVYIGGKSRGKTPLAGPVLLPPGEYVVRVVRPDGATAETRVRVGAGEAVQVAPAFAKSTEAPGNVPTPPEQPAPTKIKSRPELLPEDDAVGRYRLGVRLQAGVPSGLLSNDTYVSDVFGVRLGLGLDAGVRVIERWLFGVYFEGGSATVTTCGDATPSATFECTATYLRYGFQGAVYLTPPERTSAWLGLGIGWESIHFTQRGLDAAPDAEIIASGFEVSLDGGVDFAITPGSFRFGPVVTLGVGDYARVERLSTTGDSSEDGGAHLWASLGIRAAFWP